MGNPNLYPIRGKIAEKPQIETKPASLDIVIGRLALPRPISTKTTTEQHPLETFVNIIESDAKNNGKGTIVRPELLMLREITPDIFDQLYESWSSQYTNKTFRNKKKNVRGITKDIRQVFSEQMKTDAAYKLDTMNDTIKHQANMFEPDVDYIDFDELEDPEEDNAYFSRGPARLKLRKRLVVTDDDTISVAPSLDSSETISVIVDDLQRINSALREVGLLSTRVRQFKVEDLEIDVPVFSRNREYSGRDSDPFFPLVPMGMIEFQPLSIHEIH